LRLSVFAPACRQRQVYKSAAGALARKLNTSSKYCVMKLYLPLAAALFLAACSPPKQSTTIVTRTSNQAMTEPADSVIFVKSEIEIEQKDKLPQILGGWTLVSMQRQTKLPLENLSDVTIKLNPGGQFTANTSCGTLNGQYTVKGMSIKFNNVSTTWNACNNSDQVNEMVRLLQNTVSMYTVEGNVMTWRDNSSNIVFQARR
jgi:heat shock protein HslJ